YHTVKQQALCQTPSAAAFFKEKKAAICLRTFMAEEYDFKEMDDEKSRVFIKKMLDMPFTQLKKEELQKLKTIMEDEDKSPGLIFFKGPLREMQQSDCLQLLTKQIRLSKTDSRLSKIQEIHKQKLSELEERYGITIFDNEKLSQFIVSEETLFADIYKFIVIYGKDKLLKLLSQFEPEIEGETGTQSMY